MAPSLGRRQVYKIIDVLLAADTGYARGAVFSRLPRAALPPGSLVVAFSPLLDGRFVEALSFLDGGAAYRVEPHAAGVRETRVEARRLG